MGNFTVSSYNGLNIVRSKAFRKKDPKSKLQIKQRVRMTLMAGQYNSTIRLVISSNMVSWRKNRVSRLIICSLQPTLNPPSMIPESFP